MLIHGRGVRTRVQELPISTNHIKQPNSSGYHEISRFGGQVHRKVYTTYPSIDYHNIYLPKFDICITLFLSGLFSYLLACKPSIAALEVIDGIYLITTEGRWTLGPYAYENSKEHIMGWEGNIT